MLHEIKEGVGIDIRRPKPPENTRVVSRCALRLFAGSLVDDNEPSGVGVVEKMIMKKLRVKP